VRKVSLHSKECKEVSLLITVFAKEGEAGGNFPPVECVTHPALFLCNKCGNAQVVLQHHALAHGSQKMVWKVYIVEYAENAQNTTDVSNPAMQQLQLDFANLAWQSRLRLSNMPIG
jgi:hypothetical protein